MQLSLYGAREIVIVALRRNAITVRERTRSEPGRSAEVGAGAGSSNRES